MTDIYLGIAVVLLVATGLFAVGLKIGRTASKRVAAGLAGAATGAILLHSFVLLGEPRLAWLLPFSNLVVVGNWSPLAVGFLGGLAWRRSPGRLWRRLLVVAPLTAVCLHYAYSRLLGEPPACEHDWLDGVCLQTSRATCSAACAATILKAHGISTSEREMVELCLTRQSGTTPLGLYRGLKLKAAGTPWDVEVFDWSLDELRQKVAGPVILFVRLEEGATDDPRYESDWGWRPGLRHAVVFFRFVGGKLVEMGDPSVGRENWSVDSLRVLWHGLGMRLVRRVDEAEPAE